MLINIVTVASEKLYVTGSAEYEHAKYNIPGNKPKRKISLLPINVCFISILMTKQYAIKLNNLPK